MLISYNFIATTVSIDNLIHRQVVICLEDNTPSDWHHEVQNVWIVFDSE
jgi:hypothetical protein